MDRLAQSTAPEDVDSPKGTIIEAIPAVDAAKLVNAKEGLLWAQSDAGMRAYRQMRDQLYRLTGLAQIRNRASLVTTVNSKRLELALQVSAVTGMAPEVVLAFWHQEGSMKMADGMVRTLPKKQEIGPLKVNISSKAHARAFAISFVLWDVYGLDEAVNLIPRKEAELLRPGFKDSLVHPGNPDQHRKRLRRLIRLGIRGGFLKTSLDMERAIRQSIRVSDLKSDWKISVKSGFDALALTLLSATVMLYAQHQHIAKAVSQATRELLVLPAGKLLPPEMARIVFNMGPGSVRQKRGFNYQIFAANKELDEWLNRHDERVAIHRWALQVHAGHLAYKQAIGKGATSQMVGQFTAAANRLVAAHTAFVKSTAGKRALPAGYRSIPSVLSAPLNQSATMKAWQRFFRLFQPIADQIKMDWETWEAVALVNPGIWIVSAYGSKGKSLKRWQRAMRPITRRANAQQTAVKQKLFRLDARRIFHPDLPLQFP